MKTRRKLVTVVITLSIVCLIHILICIMVPVTITPVPTDIRFTNRFHQEAYLCLPAAYTSIDGEIEGSYIINGKTKGSKSLKEYVSIHPSKGLIVGNKWYSNNGFQQHILVKGHKARKFKDERKRYRRALCSETSDSPSYLIIESRRPMTLSDFSQEISHYCYNAVNLDMGDYGYGWIGRFQRRRWAKYNQGKQTSWIVCDKP